MQTITLRMDKQQDPTIYSTGNYIQSPAINHNRKEYLKNNVYEEANGNPIQYSCLENSVDRGAWWVQFMHDLETVSCLPTPAGFCAPVTLEVPQLSMRVYGHQPHSAGLSSPDKCPCLSLSLALWHRDSEARVLDLEPVMTLFVRLTLFSLRFHICMLSVVTVHSH